MKELFEIRYLFDFLLSEHQVIKKYGDIYKITPLDLKF